MGRKMEEKLESRSQLAREICFISSIFASCPHRRCSSRKPVFVDWYLILRVGGDVGRDVIRRRYRQLALQLHPDKNRHPKADVAFKLVSEAYACLSDEAKRKCFDFERQKSFCKECYRKSHPMSSGSHCNFQKEKTNQNRLKEECVVIENCLRANKAYRKEFPIFNPSEQLLHSPCYPHYRTRMSKKPKDCWYYHTDNARKFGERGARCESPVYEMRPENQTMRTNNFVFIF